MLFSIHLFILLWSCDADRVALLCVEQEVEGGEPLLLWHGPHAQVQGQLLVVVG